MNTSAKRTCLPVRVHQIWDCIQHASVGSSLDAEKMVQIAASLHHIPKDELIADLESAVKDGLVKVETIKPKGTEVQIYALPEPELKDKGDHDWYCFQCHVGGEVIGCEDCPRVYHLDCLDDAQKPKQDWFTCPACHIKSTKPSAEKVNIKPKQLNTLILYCVRRILDWNLQYLITADGQLWAEASGRSPKEAWRYDYFVHSPIDLKEIEKKATEGKYTSIEDFQVDCETLVHAIGCYFGATGIKGAGHLLHRDIMHDINEIKLCHDCFRRSNEKDHDWWFCLPCATPHEVVWAKQSGYPYWPAKVMKKEGTKYDVRYFGGSYDRGLVDSKNIQAIETPTNNLKVRKTALWNEAYDELQKFMDIAKNPELVETLPPRKSAGKAKGRPSKAADEASPSPAPKKRKISESVAKSTPTSTPEPKKRGRSPQKPKASTTPARTPPVRPTATANQTNGMSTLKKSVVTPKTPANSNSSSDQNSTPSNIKTETTAAMLGLFDEFCLKLQNLHQEDQSERKSKISEEHQGKGFQDPAVSSSCNESQDESRFGERVKNALHEYRELFVDRWMADVSAVKRKQWCFNCEREAIYHCCWNTAYCSTTCQQLHWTKEHKRLCRRIKRDRNGNPIANQTIRDDF